MALADHEYESSPSDKIVAKGYERSYQPLGRMEAPLVCPIGLPRGGPGVSR